MLKSKSFRSAGNLIRNLIELISVMQDMILSPASLRLRWRQIAEWLVFNLLLSLWIAALMSGRDGHGSASVLLIAAVGLLVRNVSRPMNTAHPLR